MVEEHYQTKWWTGKHPLTTEAEKILETYLPPGTSDFNPSKVKSANPKIKKLRELIHKHYRFYNDGDSFTYSGVRIGQGHKSRFPGVYKTYYDHVEEDNKALKLLEEEIEFLVKQIWTLTEGATK